MAKDDHNLVVYDQNPFELDKALGARKWQWAVLSRWHVGVLIDARFADMPFVR